MPSHLANASLLTMRQTARRRIFRRQIARVTLAAASLLLLSWLALPEMTSIPTCEVAVQQMPRRSSTSIHELSEAALLDALRKAGYGIAIAGPANHQEILLVSQNGNIHTRLSVSQ